MNQGQLTSDILPKIVLYLNEGEPIVCAPGLVGDVLCQENSIIGPLNILSDGVWAWPSDLSFYIENYNVAIPQAFVQHMIDANWKISDFDVFSVAL
ncbi:hypothetical protein [Kiloniella sp.]|uniref:hypothetical protein n=1 Tax=Kiloniella sp. TaxID=1938587 RepID=UPI003B021F6B